MQPDSGMNEKTGGSFSPKGSPRSANPMSQITPHAACRTTIQNRVSLRDHEVRGTLAGETAICLRQRDRDGDVPEGGTSYSVPRRDHSRSPSLPRVQRLGQGRRKCQLTSGPQPSTRSRVAPARKPVSPQNLGSIRVLDRARARINIWPGCGVDVVNSMPRPTFAD